MGTVGSGTSLETTTMEFSRNSFTFLVAVIQLIAISNALPQFSVGGDPCTRGPAHRCASLENIFECGVGAYNHCKKEREQQNTPPVLGQNKCTFGPSYWCQSMDTIFECGNGAYEHCKNNRIEDQRPTIRPPIVGADKCTQGPAHWCQSIETALQCGSGAFEHCHEWLRKQTPLHVLVLIHAPLVQVTSA